MDVINCIIENKPLILIVLLIVFFISLRKRKIYNELTWLRGFISFLPLGNSLDMLFYKKGNNTKQFIAGENLEDGDNCYFNINDGKFYKASAVSSKTGSTLIAKSLQKIKAGEKGVFLTSGKYYSKNLKRGTLYLALEPGKLTHIMPTGSDNVIRIISMVLSDKEEYFDPSSDWITHV
ncbi:MAG: hypothetical protein HY395_02620 [Candidatus Doudnabacteria bacterium]|nr:hypothetical protein [Candidatus Doudnabacteria bacterium]